MICTQCKKDKELNTDNFYFYKSKPKHMQPCKECRKNYQVDYQREHQEIQGQRFRRWHEKNKKYINDWCKEWRINNQERAKEYGKKYRQTEIGKEKYKGYRKFRQQHKTHLITDYEWQACKKYFDNTCAYCGMPEKEHRTVYGQDLHKDHVEHNGSNGLENCIPACKSCNSKKHDSDFDLWYNEENPIYTEDNMLLIIKWLSKDFKKCLRKTHK